MADPTQLSTGNAEPEESYPPYHPGGIRDTEDPEVIHDNEDSGVNRAMTTHE